jgi:uncharacterized membrane-anchored protein
MKRTKFRYNNETYLVTDSHGESLTDKSYDLYTGKKENGRKVVKVKIDKFNGQCLESLN